MVWSFLVVREAAPEHKLRVSLPPLTDTALDYSLLCPSLDPIPPTSVVNHYRCLICPDNIVPVHQRPVFVVNRPPKASTPHLLCQPRLPRWLGLLVSCFSQYPLDGRGRDFYSLETKPTSKVSAGLLSSISIAPYFLKYLLLYLLCLLSRPTRARGILNVVWEDLKRENVWLKASSDSSTIDMINCTRMDASQL
jgi:hypothetical protein